MSNDHEDRIEALEERIRRLEQAPPYFLTIGGVWSILSVWFGAWLHRVLT